MGHETGRCQRRIRPIGLSVLCAFRAPVSSGLPLGLFILIQGLLIMIKLPFIQLYVNDWSRDLEEHPMEIEGAWFRINCKLWWENATGKSEKPIDQWARILRSTEEKTIEVLNYIQNNNIGNVRFFNNGDGKPMAEIVCRRMLRDWEIRQKKAKAGKKGAKSRWQTDGRRHGTPMKYDIMKYSSISFNINTNKWESITDIDKLNWKEAYPACDIDAELKKMGEWIKANPAKGKKSNYRRFIVNWLTKAQDQGGTRGVIPEDQRPGSWLKKMEEKEGKDENR